ncbi:hypothetical protein SORBI_3004G336800 [Sorghum bicolor]|uniref:Uncharacterized protein n=1 Tax=Sorghum bicolor TaxID=4558 RepID=A0A1Z5RQR8_SORBI|nr:hypothetical protein SORBI_3004G336800 [Sorghum bicolor]
MLLRQSPELNSLLATATIWFGGTSSCHIPGRISHMPLAQWNTSAELRSSADDCSTVAPGARRVASLAVSVLSAKPPTTWKLPCHRAHVGERGPLPLLRIVHLGRRRAPGTGQRALAAGHTDPASARRTGKVESRDQERRAVVPLAPARVVPQHVCPHVDVGVMVLAGLVTTLPPAEPAADDVHGFAQRRHGEPLQYVAVRDARERAHAAPRVGARLVALEAVGAAQRKAHVYPDAAVAAGGNIAAAAAAASGAGEGRRGGHVAVQGAHGSKPGERVIEMLDQVTPVVKEMFSFMESSSSATAASASSAWPEDLPERRSLPPVLCRTRSPAHRGSAIHHPSDGDEVAMPRQEGTAKHAEHCKAPAPGQEADEGGCTCTMEEEDGQTSRREPTSTPSPTADSLRLQLTPSSVSPHLLSAPPPSPMPVVGLPMLLQSWEAMQDGHAAAAVVPPTVVAQPSEAVPTAQKDTTPVGTSMEGSTSSASLEADQPSMDSPSPNGCTQPPVHDGNTAVPNIPPPPPPLPAHRDRFQVVPSTDEPARAVPDAPPPPPSEVQGGPPALPAAKVSPAPPPPPPGSISAAVRAKRAATKLKRSTQMGSLYRRLRDRVEGSGSTHGGKRRQNGKRPRRAGAPKSDTGQGMADALAEMTKRSAYFRQIEEDAEKHAAAILELKDAIGSFQSKDMDELVRFHQHVEQRLVSLTDETQVLARFEGFPSKKLEALRTAAALYSKLDGAATKLKCWKLTAGAVSPQLDRVENYFNKVKDDVDMVERNRDEETKRLQSHSVHFDFSVLVRIKEGMVDLSSACMELALKESQDARETTTAAAARAQWGQAGHGDGTSRMLWRVFQLAFRVYNFAGGQDERADKLTTILAHEIEARRP